MLHQRCLQLFNQRQQLGLCLLKWTPREVTGQLMQIAKHRGKLLVFVLQAIDMLCGELSLLQPLQRPQCTQSVNDDHHVNGLLHNGANKRRQVTERSHCHGQQ
ncbi:hypothetical protein D3C80_1541760 [compost metagenome]